MVNTQDRLTQAFKDLRKMGFIARQRFSCCGSCAGYEVATYVGKMPPAKRAKVLGAVFYTKQDDANMRRGSDGFYLKYGRVEPSGCDPVGIHTVEAGKVIVEVLKKHGIDTEWSGSPDEGIWVAG